MEGPLTNEDNRVVKPCEVCHLEDPKGECTCGPDLRCKDSACRWYKRPRPGRPKKVDQSV
jgi:hypothetical protein